MLLYLGNSILVVSEDTSKCAYPKFKSYDEIKAGRRFYNVMYFAIKDPISSEMIMGIQLEKGNTEKEAFSNYDEMCLEIITKFLPIKLIALSTKNELIESKKKNNEIINFFESILGERTVNCLIVTLKSEVAKYMGFEKSSVLIYNLKENVFITNTEDTLSQIVKYPVNIGLIGEVFQTKNIYFSNNGKKDPKYDTMLEQSSGCLHINNFLIFPTCSRKGEVNGIISLFNKENGQINKFEIDLLASIQNILHSLIDFILAFHDSANIIISLKNIIGKLFSIVYKNDLNGKALSLPFSSFTQSNINEIYSNLDTYLDKIHEIKA